MGCRRYQQHDLNALQWMDLKIPNLSISNSTPFYQIHTIDDDSALKINIDFFENEVNFFGQYYPRVNIAHRMSYSLVIYYPS